MCWGVEGADCCCLRELPEAEPVELMLSGVPALSENINNATFNNISVILWRKPEYPEKTTDLPQRYGHSYIKPRNHTKCELVQSL